jgi:hypothetical protein
VDPHVAEIMAGERLGGGSLLGLEVATRPGGPPGIDVVLVPRTRGNESGDGPVARRSLEAHDRLARVGRVEPVRRRRIGA